MRYTGRLQTHAWGPNVEILFRRDKKLTSLFLFPIQLIVSPTLYSVTQIIIPNMTLLLFFITLILQFRGGTCQDLNGILLAEKVLAVERLMLSPGTIDFQVAPRDFLLNGPPESVAGDQVSLFSC